MQKSRRHINVKNMFLRNCLLSIFVFAASFAGASLAATEQKFPDVVSVTIRSNHGNLFDFDVTVSSPYDSGSRYADGFRITGDDGKVYGVRKLWHDHSTEQPFTRDLYGVKIPRGVRIVKVQARDQKYGYGGKTVVATLPGRP